MSSHTNVQPPSPAARRVSFFDKVRRLFARGDDNGGGGGAPPFVDYRRSSNDGDDADDAAVTSSDKIRQQQGQGQEVMIAVMGTVGAGKTSLIRHYITPEIAWDVLQGDLDPTIEDCYRKEDYIDGCKYLVNILDTVEMDEIHRMRDDYIFTARAFLVAFALDNRVSFKEDVPFHIQRIKRAKDMQTRHTPIIIVGCKGDFEEERMVDYEEADSYATSLGAVYVETSSKNKKDVRRPFKLAIRGFRSILSPTYKPVT
eukprot:TRINITY_DN15833_c0_g1_i1.p1 TRINITY_DN15833_c0_g1~~TRINITY_DN15833_c0_g1_i1.p1  ORF type:complete len:277 (+),score=52.74 TRINITY_DN15833_c0_g1_i1:61-831(+)